MGKVEGKREQKLSKNGEECVEDKREEGKKGKRSPKSSLVDHRP